MSTVKIFVVSAVVIFGAIGAVGWWKKQPQKAPVSLAMVEEIPLGTLQTKEEFSPKSEPPEQQILARVVDDSPDVDRIMGLFALDSSKLPIVETVSYTSRVPWLKGRPAWIADYASHYETSRHFIARSLNHKPDYFTQKVGPGDKFNVFKKDKNIQFHLLIDLSCSKLWFYAVDLDLKERILLKTYRVGLGRLDSRKASGSLTPMGTYKPGTLGFFQDQKTEMIRIFGTRWIPFEQEIAGCSESAKGLGLHGAPWATDPISGGLIEDLSKIGKYDSDGCIRLAQEDMEEIFAIVITKPTTIELVKDLHDHPTP